MAAATVILDARLRRMRAATTGPGLTGSGCGPGVDDLLDDISPACRTFAVPGPPVSAVPA
jgi:hypothetical protein